MSGVKNNRGGGDVDMSGGFTGAKNDWICAICQTNNQGATVALPCSILHVFHASCITRWAAIRTTQHAPANCPTCRAEFDAQELFAPDEAKLDALLKEIVSIKESANLILRAPSEPALFGNAGDIHITRHRMAAPVVVAAAAPAARRNANVGVVGDQAKTFINTVNANFAQIKAFVSRQQEKNTGDSRAAWIKMDSAMLSLVSNLNQVLTALRAAHATWNKTAFPDFTISTGKDDGKLDLVLTPPVDPKFVEAAAKIAARDDDDDLMDAPRGATGGPTGVGVHIGGAAAAGAAGGAARAAAGGAAVGAAGGGGTAIVPVFSMAEMMIQLQQMNAAMAQLMSAQQPQQPPQ